MKRYKGTLRIWSGEEAKDHPEWCAYEENEWMRASEVDAEMKELKTNEGYLADQNFWMEKEIARLRKEMSDYKDFVHQMIKDQ